VASPDRRLAWVAWATVCVVWGTTYLAIKIGLETIPPFLMGGFRYIAAGLMLGGLAVARGHRLPPRSTWGRLAGLGFCMLLLGNGGVSWGVQFLPSGLTAVLVGTSPFWMTGIDAMLRGGKQLFLRQWVGLVVGFAGITLLVWPDITAGGAAGWSFAMGVVALQVACAGWAVGSVYTRRQVLPGHVFGAAAVQMAAGGVFMMGAGTLLGEWSRLGFSADTTLALCYLTLAGSVIGFAAYSYALQHLDVAIVSLYTYVNPVIAVGLGTVVLGEPFHLRMVVAAGVIMAGIVIVGPPRPDDRRRPIADEPIDRPPTGRRS
jgi:drug/metabolite transporter (DMT)-like permease